MTDRIIILLDMDCFYVQVEERDNPHIKGNPAAVVQYNTWKGGGIIAVNYEARDFGVKRGMRGDEAKEKCSNIHLIQVPTQRGKADLTKYRNAGKEVVSVLCEFSDCVERASIDEAYIDLTRVVDEKSRLASKVVDAKDLPSTWVIGYDVGTDDVPLSSVREEGLLRWLGEASFAENESDTTERLALAALLCEQMRQRVLEVTGFKCSAGISHNKVLGKLACGLHKPNQQSILPMHSVPGLWSKMPIGKIRNLGGKLGDSLTTDLDCHTMSDLCNVSSERLKAKFDDKTALWLQGLGRGIDHEPVVARHLPRSIGCSKNFSGKEALNSKEQVWTWINSLADELTERLIEDEESNDRMAKTLTVHVRTDSDEKSSMSRSCHLPSYKADAIAKTALSLISPTNTTSSKNDKWSPPLRNISLSASKFESVGADGTQKIDDIFKVMASSSKASSHESQKGEKTTIDSVHRSPLEQSSGRITSPQSIKTTEKGIKNGSYANSFFLQYLAKKTNEERLKNSNLDNPKINTVMSKDFVVKDNISRNSEEFDSIDNECIDIDDEMSSDFIEKKSRKVSSSLVSKSKIHSFSDQLNHGHSLSSTGAKGHTDYEKTDSASTLSLPSSSTIPPDNLNGISVEELFPDLDNVDQSVVEILPSDLQKRVQQALNQHRRCNQKEVTRILQPKPPIEVPIDVTESENETEVISLDCENPEASVSLDTSEEEEFKLCGKCNRMILSTKFFEHQDYHFASELRRQQINESKILVISETKRKLRGGKTRGKNSKKSKISPLSRIDNYFSRKDR